MAWDSTRPVPWKRLIRDWLLYVGIMVVVFAGRHRRPPDGGRCSSACSVSGPLYVGVRRRAGQVRLPAQDAEAAPGRVERARRAPRTQRRPPRRARPATGRAHPAHLDRPPDRTSRSASGARHSPARGTKSPALTSLRADVAPTVAVSSPSTPAPPACAAGPCSPTPRRSSSYREFTQHYPEPGWVEHDAVEIWEAGRRTLLDVVDAASPAVGEVAAIGITNQRETVVAWNRRTGQPYGTAIVWQDRRTAARCDELTAAGALPLVREHHRAGARPVLLRHEVRVAARATATSPSTDDLALGTIDSWLLWNLTGGEVHATDPSNASRTMLFDIRTLQWSTELCDLLGVPHRRAARRCMPSSGRFGVTSDRCGVPAGIPISGIAGDQQAALFGQACFDAGHGQEHLRHRQLRADERRRHLPARQPRACSPRWPGPWPTARRPTRSKAPSSSPAPPCSGCATGLSIIDAAAEVGPLAPSRRRQRRRVRGARVHRARQPVVGSVRTRHHRRASPAAPPGRTSPAPRSRRWRTRPATPSMRWWPPSGTPIRDLRVDGGASVMDLLLQLQADQLGVTVRRPTDQETTALGAAFLAGPGRGRVAVARRDQRPLAARRGVRAGRWRHEGPGRRAARSMDARRRAIAALVGRRRR